MGELRTYVRVRAEGVGILVKTGVTFLVILLGERNKSTSALLAFALGQLSYAVVLLLSYITTYGLAPLTFVRLPGLLCVHRNPESNFIRTHIHRQVELFRRNISPYWVQHEYPIYIQTHLDGGRQVPCVSHQSTRGSRWLCPG
jgi:hypothetical protein